jgi:hypothetical protein
MAAVWETWNRFEFQRGNMRDLGDCVLWLGHVQMRGNASGIELGQEFAIHGIMRDGKLTQVHTFLTWEQALAAAGQAA